MFKKRIKSLLKPLTAYLDFMALPESAQHAHREDCLERPLFNDPGIDAVVQANIEWLYIAQDNSPDLDGGVARHFSLIDGWGAPCVPKMVDSLGILHIIPKVVYTSYFFEPQNIEQEISNAEIISSKFCGFLFCASIFKIDN